MTTHILILGGTGEARQLAEHLAARGDLRVTTSLAGRTRTPRPLAGETRVGGFGGAEGLVRYLRENDIGLLIDATHPFAARMARNAAEAAAITGVRLVTLTRPAWEPGEGDDWRMANDVAEAAGLLGAASRRVFLAIGRQEVAAFAQAPQHHYLIRSVEPVDPAHLPPRATCILSRGPFSEDDERALLIRHGCKTIVAKNSGGTATYGKIAAARALGLPVIMVVRPKQASAAVVHTVGDAVKQVEAHLIGLSAERGA
ncbi:cobalt-precorrin-6A reductase [Nitratireductor thuwali]|uniref:Precorrin-6A reductase n=1 Tax=Nitratireductor thuwali TaxID=2267699 RepID=A0ABY5MP45_9HYPH|nr:Precorrin-6A reductase [Nitratireductor thuwali]